MSLGHRHAPNLGGALARAGVGGTTVSLRHRHAPNVGGALARAGVGGTTVSERHFGAPNLRGAGRLASMAHQAKVITVSDGVADGTREDRSGVALVAHLTGAGYDVVAHSVTPDGADAVADAVRGAASGFAGLIVTTGGTGFGPRDLTPEGTARVLDREAPGLAEAMRLVSPLGRLSRAVAGTIGEALVLNTPGSTAGCIETLDAVLDVVPHALDLLAGGRPH